MRIQEIAKLCRKRKIVKLYQVGDEQWVSNGSAIYPLHGLPRMERDNLFTVMDVSNSSQDDYFYDEQTIQRKDPAFPICFEDYCEGEELGEKEELVISYHWEHVQGIKTSSGTVFFDSELLKPFEGDYGFYIRFSPQGVPYIAVKKGMILIGIVFVKDVLTPDILEKMSGFCLRCRLAYENLAPKDEMEENQIHFYQDGEGKE